MEKFKLYKIGGCVRDSLLGLKPKDIDYVFVFNKIDISIPANVYFNKMEECLINMGVTIYQKRPDCFTIRGKFNKEDVDYVMARKEIYNNPNSRIPFVTVGTLYEDQMRRDFTINAIAEDENGILIDSFNGLEDLNYGILRTPKDAVQSFKDDPLRILRAMRFSVTKEFSFSDEIVQAIRLFNPERMSVVSVERIREEMVKMFQKDTYLSLRLLQWLDGLNPILYTKLFENGLKLEPTLKK